MVREQWRSSARWAYYCIHPIQNGDTYFISLYPFSNDGKENPSPTTMGFFLNDNPASASWDICTHQCLQIWVTTSNSNLGKSTGQLSRQARQSGLGRKQGPPSTAPPLPLESICTGWGCWTAALGHLLRPSATFRSHTTLCSTEAVPKTHLPSQHPSWWKTHTGAPARLRLGLLPTRKLPTGLKKGTPWLPRGRQSPAWHLSWFQAKYKCPRVVLY